MKNTLAIAAVAVLLAVDQRAGSADVVLGGGKSGGKGGDSLDKTVSEFTINPDPKESAGAEHEAIVAALSKTAAQIDAANKRGLPPWQAEEAIV